jgi:VanZ family protein
VRPERFVSLWLPVVAWAGVIFYFSSIPDLRITQEWYDLLLRKGAHLFMFGGLALLLSRALAGSTPLSRTRLLVFSWTLTFLYACSDELHQSFVAGRMGSLLDVGIDSAGAWLALRARQ